METASSVIKDALSELLVQGSEQPLQSSDFQTGVRYLNRMMTSFDAQGLPLGYTKVTYASDLITIPDGAIEGVVFNLALRLAPQYDIPVSNELRLNASHGLDAIRDIAVVIEPTPFPCTMPIGSGNEQESTFDSQHFYPCLEDEVLTEQGGSILLESDT